MRGSQPRSRTTHKAGLLALAACGDGFWEFDLLAGSAWFSEWFYRKLNWTPDAKRTLLDLQPLVQPGCWEELMRKLRAPLERALPLDLELRVQVAEERFEWWQLRGAARRNEAGQPLYLAGSVRDVSAERKESEITSSLLCLRSAFDALPVAAAILDANRAVLRANRKWHEFSEREVARVIARLKAAKVHSPVELSLDPDGCTGGGARPHRVRAAPFEHNELEHVVVTLEDS